MADKELSGGAEIGRNRAREMVYPVDVSDVQKTVRDAVKKKNSISVYASTAQCDVGLSLSKMNRVLEIDAANLVAIVEPGLRLGDPCESP